MYVLRLLRLLFSRIVPVVVIVTGNQVFVFVVQKGAD